MIGAHIQEFSTVFKQSIGDAKKILLVVNLPFNHYQAQKSIAHIGVAARIVPYTDKLKGILFLLVASMPSSIDASATPAAVFQIVLLR